MKNTIVYALVFITAFIATTAGIYKYNNEYENIFEFDFRNAKEVALADSIATETIDSMAISDTVNTAEVYEEKAKEYEEHFTKTKVELDRTTNELSKKEKELAALKGQLQQKEDAKHQAWLKSTIKLYESMEVTKAGQLLKSLPEIEARELVYAMKKKKAAEILSNLDTETVKRLTRATK